MCVCVNDGETRKEEREEGRKEIERKGTARNRHSKTQESGRSKNFTAEFFSYTTFHTLAHIYGLCSENHVCVQIHA